MLYIETRTEREELSIYVCSAHYIRFRNEPSSKKYEKARQQLHREIIEIGATKVNSAGEIIDTFSCFVKPEFSSDVAGYITKLTGIKTTDVYQAASFAEALQNFQDGLVRKKREFTAGVTVIGFS